MKPLKYLLYQPTGDVQDVYPLVIFLHGIGERGDDLNRVKKWGLPRYAESGEVALPAYLVAPQCPDDVHWSDIPDRLDAMLDELLANYPIDADRVYLTGFSMGSFGTWRWSLRRPERFAALLPVGGNGYWSVFALEHFDFTPLKSIPLWMVHGALDAAVPVAGADEFAAALVAVGANFGYTRYPDANHGESCDRAFIDRTILNWLLAQKRGSS
ncbi:MAG: prolyl oligopeptidase family serine peptidase [Anaerolineae bacterium]